MPVMPMKIMVSMHVQCMFVKQGLTGEGYCGTIRAKDRRDGGAEHLAGVGHTQPHQFGYDRGGI